MNARLAFEDMIVSSCHRPGIFCDFSALRVTTPEDSTGTINTELVRYLNARHAAGTPVVIISSAPEEAQKFAHTLGLEPALCTIKARQDHYCCILDTLIDPCPSLKLRAERHWEPDNQTFLAMIRAFFDARPVALTEQKRFPVPDIAA